MKTKLLRKLRAEAEEHVLFHEHLSFKDVHEGIIETSIYLVIRFRRWGPANNIEVTIYYSRIRAHEAVQWNKYRDITFRINQIRGSLWYKIHRFFFLLWIAMNELPYERESLYGQQFFNQ